MDVYKRKDFARWQVAERLSDKVLCAAVEEMRRGLVDACLGRELFKKRVRCNGGGKQGGYRTLLSARAGTRYVFLHGFAKSDKSDVSPDERKALQFAGKVFLDLPPSTLAQALNAGILMEICCEQQTD